MSKWRIFIWLWLFFPYGFYLLFKHLTSSKISSSDSNGVIEKPTVTVTSETSNPKKIDDNQIDAADISAKEEQEHKQPHKTTEDSDISDSDPKGEIESIADLEMVLFCIMAMWGDDGLSKSEVSVLSSAYQKRAKKLASVRLSDKRDKILSQREYIIGLHDFVSKEAKKIEYDSIELTEEFSKKYLKESESFSVRRHHKIFLSLIDDLVVLYTQHSEKYAEKAGQSVEKLFRSKIDSLHSDLMKIAESDGTISEDETFFLNVVANEQYKTLNWLERLFHKQ